MMKKLAVFLLCAFVSSIVASGESIDNGCTFLRTDSQKAPYRTPSVLLSADFDGYLRIFYSPSDPLFTATGDSGVPDILQLRRPVFDRTRHFFQTELGWQLPASRVEDNHPVLSVYFVPARKKFSGTVVQGDRGGLRVILNRNLLRSDDFAALWIHQIAHAAQIQYRPDGEDWFWEALAGWVEGQFDHYSAVTLASQSWRLSHPEVSLTDPSPIASLGASRFVEMLARPNRDVIRLILEQWASAENDSMIASISSVLQLCRLPDLDSYLQNYFLLCAPNLGMETGRADVVLQPYSAAVFQDFPLRSSGGVTLSFFPEGGLSYSAAVLFFAKGERSGTLAMRKGITEVWAVPIPYAGLDHCRYVVSNVASRELRGRLEKAYDPTLPGVLEYFRAVQDDGAVQIEWKTARENGVAFWNLYRIEAGTKVRMNDFPIPAAVNSDEGVHYIFVDYNTASFYTLEAVTSEGFPSPFASLENPR